MLLLPIIVPLMLFIVTSAFDEAPTYCTHMKHLRNEEDLEMALEMLEKISEDWGDRSVRFSQTNVSTHIGYCVPVCTTASDISHFPIRCNSGCVELNIAERAIYSGHTRWSLIVDEAHRVIHDCVIRPRIPDPHWDGPKSGWRTLGPLYSWLNVSVVNLEGMLVESNLASEVLLDNRNSSLSGS